MPRSFNPFVLIIMLLMSSPVAKETLAQPTEHELRAVERSWLDAYERNDVESMRRIVADNFVITYPNGLMLDKAQTIAALDPDAGDDPDSRMFTEDDSVRFFGDGAAVITGLYVYEVTRADGTTVRDESRYTDTYLFMNDRWQVIASHLSKPD